MSAPADVLASVLASTQLLGVGAVGAPMENRLVGPNVPLPGYRRLFGGQLLAQAMAAACYGGAAGNDPEAASGADAGPSGLRTVRSIHMAFAAEGRPDEPVEWSVEAPHSGRTFATRCVNGSQGNRVLAVAIVSLHRPDGAGRSLQHCAPVPQVTDPERSPPVAAVGAMALETRVALPLDPTADGYRGDGHDLRLDGLEQGPPEVAVWMRAGRPLGAGGGQLAQQMLLAYSSDVTMMVAAMRPHPGIGYGSKHVAVSAVTSHTVSFHTQVDLGDWMLFAQHSPVAAGGRAYIRGDWFARDGSLAASCAQEALIRLAAP
ncbi:MAG: acyl-CoA thioesterase [Acidimicrobiales bacterium]